MLRLDVSVGADTNEYCALLEAHLNTKQRVVATKYPVIRIGDWHVYYDPDSLVRHRMTGVLLPWCARQASRSCNSTSLRDLLELLKEDETKE